MPGPIAAPVDAGAPSAATVASSTPATSPRQPAWAAATRGTSRRHIAHGQAVGAQHHEGRSRRPGDQPVALGPVAQVAEEAALAPAHLADARAVDLTPHRDARRIEAERRADPRAVLPHPLVGIVAVHAQVELREAAGADPAAPGGEHGARRARRSATSISSRRLTRPSRAIRNAIASCSSWPPTRPSRTAARTSESARPIAGPGGTPSRTRSGAADARAEVGRPPGPDRGRPVGMGADRGGRRRRAHQAVDLRRAQWRARAVRRGRRRPRPPRRSRAPSPAGRPAPGPPA